MQINAKIEMLMIKAVDKNSKFRILCDELKENYVFCYYCLFYVYVFL